MNFLDNSKLATLQRSPAFSLLAFLALSWLVSTSFAQVPKTELVPSLTFNLSKYVEWPDTARAREDEPYWIIGVYDSDAWLQAFHMLEGKAIHGKTAKVIQLKDGMAPDDMRRCQIIFTSKPNVLSQLKSVALRGEVLAVTDVPSAAQSCKAGIELVPNGSKLGFEVCLDCLKASNLEIRANLLKIAIEVHGEKHESP